jgi:hypothetical protein
MKQSRLEKYFSGRLSAYREGQAVISLHWETEPELAVQFINTE